MKASRKIMSFMLAAIMTLCLLPNAATITSASNMYENSDFVETEQPELSEETKKLISAYQKDPTEENFLNLRDMVIENYNAVLARKEAKLAELIDETQGKPGGTEIVAEMEEIVQDMYITYWSRINSSMLRFTDDRLLKWKISNAANYEYIPVMGAGESIYVKRTPVTNAEYAEYAAETGAALPQNWNGGKYADGEDNYPVNFVSYEDAEKYCEWLTEKDGKNTYRLPSESEWELAAGHMPKDADFNCGINDGRTSVYEYDGITRGAHGAIDFWGNVWEWTSTVRTASDGADEMGVKGGSWKSERTDCRTEYRKEGRDAAKGYDDVGFRVIQVKGGIEPEQKVELATLGFPNVTVSSTTADSITLSWGAVDGAVEYQLFEYFEDSGLVSMLQRTKETTAVFDGLENGSTHSYIVQPISYREIADNVSAENRITATCTEQKNNSESSGGGNGGSGSGNSRDEKLENKAEKIDAAAKLRELKQLAKAAKIEQLTYLKEIRELFRDADRDERQEILDELAAIKEEMKDYSIDTFVNGVYIDYEKYDNVKPVIENGRTLAPVRAISEALGAEVLWNDAEQKITITKDSTVIEMTIGNSVAYVNGKEKMLDCAPEIRNDRTLVPVRFIAESFNLIVDWDEDSSSVIIGEADEMSASTAKLLYQGQGSIRIVTAEGKVIYIDPYAGQGYDLAADLILVTHAHSDHNAIDKIESRNSDCVIITQNEAIKDGVHQTFDFGYVKVEAVEAGYNEMHDPNECVGYVLTFTNGKKVYVSGDTSTTPQMSQMVDMQIDYAFFCCDGVFNMGLEEAARCAEIVGAKHNIPYHMTGKTPRIYDRKIAEQFPAPNSMIVDAGEEIEIL